jgi:formyltetrahydrofolate deformylase
VSSTQETRGPLNADESTSHGTPLPAAGRAGVMGEQAGAAERARTREIPPYTARLLIDCADQPGIVAAVSGFLFELGANIVSSNQYSSDPIGGRFYLRTEFFLDGIAEDRERFRRRFNAEVAERFGMEWEIRYRGERRRVAILVSRHDHCLVDLLWRWRRGELDADVVAVLSNHPDLAEEAAAAGVPYHHVPVAKGAKQQAEARMLELLHGNVELVVLARYMQILSGDFLGRLGVPVINIHHSFLPAFAGADPYRRAREHGVKLIGATAHYVTAELDGGPIIEQDVARVDHRQSARELERIGRDIERLVLWRAVSLHLDDRVIADSGRTIVF